MKINDHFKILATKKGADLVQAFYGDKVVVDVVNDGDQLDLGHGQILNFYSVPNVHWPETMFTYESKSQTLFSCDMYGAFGAMNDHVFDDQMTESEKALYEDEGIRYFSNVMTTFSTMVERAIKKTESLNVQTICPGHGPVYRENPNIIIDAYKRYCQYAKGFGKEEVTLLWGSMYGMTEKAVNQVVAMLEESGVKVNALQVPQASKSDIVSNVFKSAAVILAAPTYEYKLFPPMAHAIDEIGRKRITGKHAFRFGSYGWSGGAEKELQEMIENYRLKWTFLDSVEFKGMPKEVDYDALESSVKTLVEKMKEHILS
jgi:flavorubredoxin